MNEDPLVLVPVDRWSELQSALLKDWPRCLPGYHTLAVQARIKRKGYDYGFEVYSLHGDFGYGFIGVNKKVNNYELIIQYTKDDTSTLEKALRETGIINWNSKITLAFMAPHVMEVIQTVIKDKNVVLDLLPSWTFVIEKGSPFEDISLPSGYTFEPLTTDHIDLIDEKWPHRYPQSRWYFKLLIDTNSGYGLFKNGTLTCWLLVGECGQLTHLYTLEEYRKQGLAELILKLVSNELMKANRQIFAFCVKGNHRAENLYKKMNFKPSNDVVWGFLDIKS